MAYPSFISSVQLSRILDLVIGTEDVVMCRRLTFSPQDDSSIEYRVHIIGSRPDGMDLPGSDLDHMNILKFLQVSDTLSLERKCPLLAVFVPNSTGYAYLEVDTSSLIDGNDNRKIATVKRTIKGTCTIQYKESDKMLMSSLLFVNCFHVKDSTIRGPSLLNLDANFTVDTDNVFGFECKSWPIVANEWLHRKRKYSWPTARVITLIKYQGCQFITISEFMATMGPFQWRVSFVLSEQFLVRTFNHIQFKVYGLLKLLKLELLSSYRDIFSNELITSYHIKTVMFWILENTPQTIWIPQRFILCCNICLVYLRHCLQSKFLPNYFLPQCNLFRKHSNNNTNSLIAKLEMITDNLSSYLINLESLSDPTHVFFETNSATNNSHGSYPFQQNLYLKSKIEFFKYFSFCNLHAGIKAITILKTCFGVDTLSNSNTYVLQYRNLIESMLNACLVPMHHSTQRTNKAEHIERRRTKHILLRKTQLNLTGWLHMATFCYSTGEYDKTRRLCFKVIESIKPYTNYCGGLSDYKAFSSKLLASQLTLPGELKYLTAPHVQFNRQTTYYPYELEMEVENLKLNVLLIPPLPYAYFILFLCAYHQHDTPAQFLYLSHLENLKNDTFYGVKAGDTPSFIILHMIGICYELMNDTCKQQAFKYYWQALHIDGNYQSTAASNRLQLMMMH